MNTEEDFLSWVSDPRRTNDELFTVELLIASKRHALDWPHHYVRMDWEELRARGRERMLNPAYRPALHLDELRTLQERAETVNYFAGTQHEDRPLRDLKAFHFFPHLKNLNLQVSDLSDLTPLAELREVTNISIAEWGDLYGCQPISLAQCGPMPELERLHLALRHPWPDLSGMSAWPKLQHLRYNGSVLAMEEVECLPAAREVEIKTWAGGASFFRDLRRVPLMPQVRELTLECAAALDGIERFPSVLNLTLTGCFRDLAPLAQMENVTALTLACEYFSDLRPLAKMKNLRELNFRREWPLDLGPLTDCPQLRRVTFEHCAMMQTEVAALNAALLQERHDFYAPTPRPVPPLKGYRMRSPETVQSYRAFENRRHEARIAYFDGDAAKAKAQVRVFCATMQERFDQVLGRGWGHFQSPYTDINRYQDMTQLRELIDIVRRYQASLLHPPAVNFIVRPHGELSDDLEEIKEREASEEPQSDEDYLLKYADDKQAIEENAEFRRSRQERYELLKREHLLKLRSEEEAALILSASHEEPEPEPEPAPAEEEPAGEEGEGGVAIAPPPPPDDGTEDLGDELMFYLDIYSDFVSTNENWVEPAEYALGIKFEEWPLTADQEPPASA